jgi:hypothetical protein
VEAAEIKALTRTRTWGNVGKVPQAEWTCGYCSRFVASDQGWQLSPVSGGYMHIRVCSNCGAPTFFLTNDTDYAPAPLPGHAVDNVPSDLAILFQEARASAGAGAPTAAVMTCRKILMHIAVQEGAKENLSFKAYVNFLAENHYTPPKSDKWVDYIRDLGNDANHEIKVMTAQDARIVIKFVQMLLEFLYEAQGMVPAPAPAPAPAAPTS